MDECHNCGVAVDEAPDGMHPVQMRYEDAGVYCEACFFDSYERTGEEVCAEAFGGDVAPLLEEAYTKSRLRDKARIFGVTLERGISKRGVAERLAEEKPRVMLKRLFADGHVGRDWY